MSRDQRSLVDYLAHIVEAIERIAQYTEDMDEAAFFVNRLVQDAVIRNFEIIGEASSNIAKRYQEFAEQHPELPFTSAYQMRNALAHGYFKVDFAIVWRTIQEELPNLHAQIKAAQAILTADLTPDAD